MVKLLDNERIDDLDYKGMKIIQKKDGFCFGMDSVLISNFSKISKNNAVIADIGTGTGIISILIAAKNRINKIYGFDIQEEMVEMANRSVELNNFKEKIEIIKANIVGLSESGYKNKFDYVITNPPYKKINTGLINDNEKKLISRHEVKCTLNDILYESANILKDKGTFYMVHRPERLPEIIVLMKKNRIEPKEIQFVYPKEDKQANLVLIKGIKFANPYLRILEPLIIYDKNGNYTEKVRSFYK